MTFGLSTWLEFLSSGCIRWCLELKRGFFRALLSGLVEQLASEIRKDRLKQKKKSLDKPSSTGNAFQTWGHSSEIHPPPDSSFLKKRFLSSTSPSAYFGWCSVTRGKQFKGWGSWSDVRKLAQKKKTQVFVFWNRVLNWLIKGIFIILG